VTARRPSSEHLNSKPLVLRCKTSPRLRKSHAPTIAYIERKTREGKSVREAIRCLKRHLARHIYRVLERTAVAA
jgi:hypothetical protein